MFQQPGPGAETTSFRTWASVDVVVKVQVTDAQVADQEIGDFVQVLDRRRMPQANQYAYGGSDVGYRATARPARSRSRASRRRRPAPTA
jgi:hypothetical protein